MLQGQSRIVLLPSGQASGLAAMVCKGFTARSHRNFRDYSTGVIVEDCFLAYVNAESKHSQWRKALSVAFVLADILRLRLCSGSLLTQPSGQFHGEIALKERNRPLPPGMPEP